MGRFAQADTVFSGGVQGFDRYVYTHNNPLRFIDPSGHIACDGSGRNGACDQSGIPHTFGRLVAELRKFGVQIKGNWSFDNLYAAYVGVHKVGDKLAQEIGTGVNATSAFKQVFKTITFEWVDGVCGGQEDRCYADANSFPTIKFYSKFWAGKQENGKNVEDPVVLLTPTVTAELVIHELGHGFDSRTGRTFNNSVAKNGITDKTGFGVQEGASGQNEVTADLFTNYVLGTFTGPGTNGMDLQSFMQTNMLTWIDAASSP